MAYDILSVDRDQAEDIVEKILPLGAVMLMGKPGTGKTFLANRVADKMGRKLYPIHSHQDVMQQELTVTYGPVEGADGKWGPIPGTLVQAMGYRINPKTLEIEDCEPGIAWFDDLHEGGSGLYSALYIAWDSVKSGAQITLPSGRVIKPKEGFMSGGTTNGLVSDLPQPVQDRLLGVIAINEPSEEMLRELNVYMQAMCLLDYGSRSATPVGTYRQYQAMSKLMDTLDIFTATAIAFHGDRLKMTAVLTSLKDAEYPGAVAALNKVMENMPSGAPGLHR